MTSREIRRQFIDFFRGKGHVMVPSSPVVPLDDPTLMFTNAGMNQFKPIFLGTVDPRSEFASLKRVANTQKCIRAGGKHNDLDDVGQDTYHHTFFEMLGNWSFGDYFKKEAIEWAWELLTKVWGIDKARLHATYFEGDDDDGLEPDTEARDLWRSVTDIDPSHIHPGNKKDNFWEMGDTGPCGPCSEIHIDLTPDQSGATLVNQGDARVIEIWNLVFIQFNRGGGGTLSPLPAKHVDTGMGFERLCAVLQGMHAARLGQFSNYDTDVFTPIFDAIQKRTAAPKYQGTLPDQNRDRQGADSSISHSAEQVMIDVSYRVIADHLRCLTFAMTDGAIPSNEGRGYVLRRILRRAVRYGRQYLNMHEPFLCDLVSTVVENFGDVFPELRTGPDPKRQRDNARYVKDIIRDEEASFLKTLDRGMKLFQEAADFARARHHGKIRGDDAFKLHDTYGFPIDLTELMAEEQGLTIDIGEYERLMEAARTMARSREMSSVVMAPVPSGLVDRFPKTDDTAKYTGLTLEEANAIALLRFEEDGTTVTVQAGDALYQRCRGAVVLDRTCFYAEQGGQVGDTGIIAAGDEDIDLLDVENTIRIGEIILHVGQMRRGAFGVGEAVHLKVNARRLEVMQNHTSTHLLNWALRQVLEIESKDPTNKVDQKGSLVDPDKTRFDFSHNRPLIDEELARIEQLCNEKIDAALPVYAATREENFVDQKKAREINTLRAVFGEKYPDKVRVVSIGAPITEEDAKRAREAGAVETDWLLRDPHNPKWMQYSVEFCGGTHVKNTSECKRFVLTHEEGVAKGIRRVVGISGRKAIDAVEIGSSLLEEVIRMQALAGEPPMAPGESSDNRHSTIDDLPSAIAGFQQRLADAEIPILARRQIQARLADLQKLAKEHEKQSAAASGGAVMGRVKELLTSAGEVNGVTVLVGEVPDAPPDALRAAIDWVRNKSNASAVLLAMVSDSKVTLIAGMSKAVVDKGVKAGDLIKEIAPLVGGKGGGRPDMAQGGGTDPSGVPRALERTREWLAGKLA